MINSQKTTLKERIDFLDMLKNEFEQAYSGDETYYEDAMNIAFKMITRLGELESELARLKPIENHYHNIKHYEEDFYALRNHLLDAEGGDEIYDSFNSNRNLINEDDIPF